MGNSALRRAELDAERMLKAFDRFREELVYFHENSLRIPERVLEPHDGGPNLRPHTRDGWWQVWSGGICIALLEPKDLEPVTEELLGRLRNAEDALRERIRSRTAQPESVDPSEKRGT